MSFYKKTLFLELLEIPVYVVEQCATTGRAPYQSIFSPLDVLISLQPVGEGDERER